MSEKESAINAEVLGEEAALPVKDRLGFADAEDDVLPLPPALTLEQERKLWRKIDRRLLPILTLMYLCSFLDRGNIGTSLMGLKRSPYSCRDANMFRQCQAARVNYATSPGWEQVQHCARECVNIPVSYVLLIRHRRRCTSL